MLIFSHEDPPSYETILKEKIHDLKGYRTFSFEIFEVDENIYSVDKMDRAGALIQPGPITNDLAAAIQIREQFYEDCAKMLIGKPPRGKRIELKEQQ